MFFVVKQNKETETRDKSDSHQMCSDARRRYETNLATIDFSVAKENRSEIKSF